MTTQGLRNQGVSTLLSAIGELGYADDELARLSALLNEAFNELQTSVSVVRLAAANRGDVVEIERSANRAITALQRAKDARQLIGATQQRLDVIRDSLSIASRAPQAPANATASRTDISAGTGPDPASVAAMVQKTNSSTGAALRPEMPQTPRQRLYSSDW